MLRLLLILIFLLPLTTSAKFVESLDDFQLHTEAHVQRVRVLGLYLFHRHPEVLRGVDANLLSEFLSLHDQAKFEPGVLKEMYKYFGRDVDDANPMLRRQMTQLFGRVNQRDEEIRNAFFRKHGMLNEDGTLTPTAHKFRRVEVIADIVDRGENPVSTQEFHKKMRKASHMLLERGHEQNAEFARELENKYSKLTRDYSFGDWKQRRRTGCPMHFQSLH
jgi:hypothetical protein